MKYIAFRQSKGSLATRIAAAILLKDKAISIPEIRSIPFVESDEEAMAIAKQLGQMFDIQVEQVRASSRVPQWVDVLRLKAA